MKEHKAQSSEHSHGYQIIQLHNRLQQGWIFLIDK
jgi:hypothetical protein